MVLKILYSGNRIHFEKSSTKWQVQTIYSNKAWPCPRAWLF